MLEGGIRRQASYILADPWANSFRKDWVKPELLDFKSRRIGAGTLWGWGLSTGPDMPGQGSRGVRCGPPARYHRLHGTMCC